MWFTEDAWSPIVLIMLVAILCCIVWFRTQRGYALTAAVLLLLAAVTTYFIEQVIVTDGEKLEASLFELIETFVAESQSITQLQQSQVVQAERFFSEQNTIDRARVRVGVIVVSISEDLRISDVQVRLTNENTRAITHFRANGTIATGTSPGSHHVSRWELTWQKQAGEWRITRTRMLNPMNGEDQKIPRVD
ncbi:MAG: hypothetical protein VB858_01880 [Planctomycetaceae bacterium]|jgi:hypothetical protein